MVHHIDIMTIVAWQYHRPFYFDVLVVIIKQQRIYTQWWWRTKWYSKLL